MTKKKKIFLGLAIFGIIGTIVMIGDKSLDGVLIYIVWTLTFGALFKFSKDKPVQDVGYRYIQQPIEQDKDRAYKGEKLNVFVDNYTIVDLETTGFSPKNDRIIEIGALKVRNNKIVDKYSILINPCRHIPKKVTELTSIDDNMVKNSPRIENVLPIFLDFIGNDIIVAHNAHFDVNFLYDKCTLLLGRPFTNKFIDTLYLARKKLPELSHHRLVDLAEYYHIKQDNAHRSLSDCETTFEVYNNLRK